MSSSTSYCLQRAHHNHRFSRKSNVWWLRYDRAKICNDLERMGSVKSLQAKGKSWSCLRWNM